MKNKNKQTRIVPCARIKKEKKANRLQHMLMWLARVKTLIKMLRKYLTPPPLPSDTEWNAFLPVWNGRSNPVRGALSSGLYHIKG